MTYTGKEEIISVLNERNRDNALRVFISGLRRPISDILFSAKPVDLPTALATAQELETNHRRHEFASTYAAGNTVRTNRTTNPSFAPHPAIKNKLRPIDSNNVSVPMDVDPGSSMFRWPTADNSQHQRQRSCQDNGQTFKRPFQNKDSSRIQCPPKTQRFHYMPEIHDNDENEEISSIGFQDENVDEDYSSELEEEQLNFLD